MAAINNWVVVRFVYELVILALARFKLIYWYPSTRGFGSSSEPTLMGAKGSTSLVGVKFIC